MTGTPYSRAETQFLTTLIADAPDAITADIARAFCVQYPKRTYDSARCKIENIRKAPARDESAAVQEWEARRATALAEVQSSAPAFEIIELPPLPVPKLRYTPNPCYVISSDHHWPLHDERVESIILQAIEVLKPRAYILNGDGPDMLALSINGITDDGCGGWRLKLAPSVGVRYIDRDLCGVSATVTLRAVKRSTASSR